MKNKKGISLIVLIITVIVMIILAGVVVVSLQKNNPIQDAKVARFKTNYQDLKVELNDNILKALKNTEGLKKEDITETTLDRMRKYIPSLPNSFASKVCIKEGNLVLKYDALTEREKDLAKDVEFSIDITSSATNPYVPIGFKHKTGTVDTGFVIEEVERKDEFVWVPINNISEFERIIFNNEYFPTLKNIDENFSLIYDSVKKYGGFYVSRYEIGREKENYVSKKGKEVCVGLSTTERNQIAADMYHRSDVQTAMMYGATWDSMVNWLVNTNPYLKDKIINGSQDIGNYQKSTGNILTGSNENYKINNIYDLAGNVREDTLETPSLKGEAIYSISRGGSTLTSSSVSIASRQKNEVDINTKDNDVGLRLMLYLK